jgi:hypothetical protein
MTITLELPEDVAIIVEQAAGEQDVTAYAVGVLQQAARRKLARRAAPIADELTPADHIRMAAEAEADASPIAEVMQRLNAYMDAAMADEAAAQ